MVSFFTVEQWSAEHFERKKMVKAEGGEGAGSDSQRARMGWKRGD